MAAVSGPKTLIPRPTGGQIPGALTRHVVLDPGIAYVVADALMFWGTNLVGMVAMAGAVGVAAGLKAVTVVQPKFAQKYPKLMALAQDDRVPLRTGGLAMLLVAGATLATGAWIPAAASFCFAIANFGLANSISKKHIEADRHLAEEHLPLTMQQKVISTLKRPDIYLNVGFALAGLMAGGAAMAIVPLVGAACYVGIKNTLAGKAEYEGHPKLVTAAAAALFAGVGFMNGHALIATAHLVNAVVLGEMERRMTPGGLPQICRDIAGSVAGFFGRQPKPVLEPAPVLAPAPAEPSAFPATAPEHSNTFNIRVTPAKRPARKLRPAEIAIAAAGYKPPRAPGEMEGPAYPG